MANRHDFEFSGKIEATKLGFFIHDIFVTSHNVKAKEINEKLLGNLCGDSMVIEENTGDGTSCLRAQFAKLSEGRIWMPFMALYTIGKNGKHYYDSLVIPDNITSAQNTIKNCHELFFDVPTGSEYSAFADVNEWWVLVTQTMGMEFKKSK